MNIEDAVKLKHFDKDLDGKISDQEILDSRDERERVAKAIFEGKPSDEVNIELVEDVFLARLIQHNLERQRERSLKIDNDLESLFV